MDRISKNACQGLNYIVYVQHMVAMVSLKFLSDSRTPKIAMWLIKFTKAVTRLREVRTPGKQAWEMDVTQLKIISRISFFPSVVLLVVDPNLDVISDPEKNKTVRSVHLFRFINNVAPRAMVRIIYSSSSPAKRARTKKSLYANLYGRGSQTISRYLSLSLLFLNNSKKFLRSFNPYASRGKLCFNW